MDSNINIRLKTMLGSLIPTTKRASQEWKTFGSSVSTAQKRMSQLYPSIRKTNMSLTNLTKDANRASKGFSMMSGSLLTVKRALGGLSFYMLYRGISNAVESAMDMIETANLFSVALGGLAVETNNTVRGMSELTGLDLTNMQTAIGTFASLSRSMGMTDTQAQNLSTTSYRLALDLASLYNVDISQALGDLRSGLVGQSETVYKYGIDVTEASLKTEALAQGITKSVRNMSQGEKMALRYAVMIRQTSLAQGDFARTIEQPANQLRILAERVVTLGRAIGTMFIPILAKVLPYLNAFVLALTMIVQRLAQLFGYDGTTAEIFNGAVNTAGGITDELDDATGSAKKLKSTLAGFDEINVLGSKQEAGGAGVSAGGAGDLGFMEGLSYDSLFDTISNRTKELADKMLPILETILKIVGLIGIGFLSWKIATTLLSGAGTLGILLSEVFTMIKKIGLLPTLKLFPVELMGWATVITIIIARFVDLYAKSENFRKGIQRVGEIFVGVFDLIMVILSPITGLLSKIAKAFVDLLPEPVKKAIFDFMNAFDLDWKDLGITALGIGLMFIPGGQVFGAILLGFQAITTLLRGLGSINDETWTKMKNGWKAGVKFIETIWSDAWMAIGNFLINRVNDILQTIKSTVNTVIMILNKLIGGANSILSAVGININIKSIKEVSFTKIPNLYNVPKKTGVERYANGGIPDYGQVFIAREAGAELVGGFGSKTAVMNNDQIVDAVSTGVAQAVASVMGGASGGTIIQVKIGEDTIVEKMVSSINRQNRLTGKTVINV